MKRRDFLVRTAGAAGALVPALTMGQTRPCPPPSLSVSGGTTANTSCVPANAEADWVARSTGEGVVWAHDFRSPSEVDAFRWQGGIGNVPNNALSDGSCRHITTDGITGGGCLEINIPTGGTARAGWWRPMSAIRAGDNGKTADDRAANGTLPKRAWNASNTNQTYLFRTGYYGHSDYHAQVPTWQGQSNIWDGTDFYLQFRVKMPASRWQPVNPYNPYGKLMFIDVTGETGDGEIVIQSSDAGQQYWRKTTPFRMYTSRGSNPNSFISHPQGAGQGSTLLPGSPYASTCTIGGDVKAENACWEWPTDEWVTVLIHVIPGHRNDGVIYETDLSKWPNKDFGIQVWVARFGQTSYTKLFDKLNLAWYYASDLHPLGAFNSICPSGYMNGVNAVLGWYHRYDQIIFSKQIIPCPQA
jgi:hypothetical protein